MSRLQLYRPVETGNAGESLALFDPEGRGYSTDSSALPGSEDVAILPFTELAVRVRMRRLSDPPERARLIHSNRLCPHCHRASVEVRDLSGTFSGARDRRLWHSVPKLGFLCTSCQAEWSA